jgi:hypothetical protein
VTDSCRGPINIWPSNGDLLTPGNFHLMWAIITPNIFTQTAPGWSATCSGTIFVDGE